MRNLTMSRGMALDGAVLGANLALMGPLTAWLEGVVRGAAADEPGPMATLFALAVALLVLAPLGATLARWHYHERRRSAEGPTPDAMAGAAGCLFNPIFYFSLVVVIWATVNAFMMQAVYGRREPPGEVFVGSVLGGIVLIVLHTWLVYRYFTPPRRAPRAAFMRGRAAALLGDAALFANMLLFQLIWGLLSFAGVGAPGGVADAVLRLGLFAFLALLLYFPPRMFYLVEDMGRRAWWVTIVIANLPAVWRLMGG